jgi:hypothetical protein
MAKKFPQREREREREKQPRDLTRMESHEGKGVGKLHTERRLEDSEKSTSSMRASHQASFHW